MAFGSPMRLFRCARLAHPHARVTSPWALHPKGVAPAYPLGHCRTNGRWRSFDGKSSGTTPFRMFFKDGVFRGAPQAAK
jgi:hypothetical protein